MRPGLDDRPLQSPMNAKKALYWIAPAPIGIRTPEVESTRV
jgi:hypothetical protein